MTTAERAKELLAAATPGPWDWFGNTASRSIYLATIDRGRQFILSFYRWGMQGATPALRGDGWMEPAEKFAVYEVCPEATSKDDERLYRHDFQGLRHPDAALIAAAPDLAQTVVDLAAENVALRDRVKQAIRNDAFTNRAGQRGPLVRDILAALDGAGS